MESIELQHWGIKGMKWGQRRYQNKDGTLTPAGKKRYEKEVERVKYETKVLRNQKRTQAKLDKLDGMKKTLKDLQDEVNPKKKAESDSKDTSEAPKKKSISEMPDDELAKAVRRKQLEEQYSKFYPEKKGLIKQMWEDAVTPALVSSGKKFLEGALDKATKGLLKDVPDPDSMEFLKKKYEKLDIMKKIKDLENPQETAVQKRNRMMAEDAIDKIERERAAKAEKDKRDKDNYDYYNNRNSDDWDGGSPYRSGKRDTNSNDSTTRRLLGEGPLTGTVFGEGTSVGSQSRKSNWPDIDNAVDIDFKDVPNDDIVSGERYIRGLLGSGKK